MQPIYSESPFPFHNYNIAKLNACSEPRQIPKVGLFVSGGLRVRIAQELDVVAFWSWNLDVVAFRPVKKRLGITMSWLICLRFSMSWCFSPRLSMSRIFESLCRSFGISMSWFFGLGVPMSWYMCLDGLVFIIIVKRKKITHNYVNYVVEKYFSCPNLCNIYLPNVWIWELE